MLHVASPRLLTRRGLLTGAAATAVYAALSNSARATASLVAHANFANAANGGTSAALDTTGATLLVVTVSFFWTQPAPTMTDSKSNTWTLRYNQLNLSGSTRAVMYTCDNAPTVGAGHTFTIAGTGIFSNCQVLAFSGMQTPCFDQATSASSTGTTSNGGTLTPSTSATVFVSGLSPDSAAGSTFSIDSGFSISDQNGGTGGASFAGAAAWLANTGMGAISPTWTLPASVQSSAGLAAFKVAATATGRSRLIQ